MIDTKVIDLVLNALETSEDKFRSSLDKFIKVGIKITNDSEEIMDELQLYEDLIFHLYITDLDLNIWIKSINGVLSYNNNLYEIIPENVHALHSFLSKTTIAKILRQEMTVAEAYLKGFIQLEGELSDAIISKNILSLFFSYINYFMKRE
ncbi:MAG: hypothetical protein KGD66_06230 [Candidatus Lokiarchaeota archaeon]|nr:hypothetical protein [Candidatus Lokiarchaeota archaeon]